MIPVTEHDQEVISSGVTESTSFEISSEDTAHIMTILRDTLYSDKVLAVIREYCSNAWDANRMAGRGDVPIRVHLPTYEDQSLRIRDVGPGLSPDDIRRIFTKYGASTKRNSNEAVGMLGIGSKSGFAYSDSFTVSSWHGGRRRMYVAVIDASQKGRIDLLHEEPCDPTETGVEIEIPVRPEDIDTFRQRAQELLVYMDPLPEVNIQLSPPCGGEEVDDLGTVRINSGYYDNGSWTAVMGCVPYRVDLGQLKVGDEHIGEAARSLSGTIWFDIGELQVAASREDLKYGDTTKLALIERINGLVDEFVRRKLEGIDLLNDWDKRLRAQALGAMRIPLPAGLKDMASSYVRIDKPNGLRLLQLNRWNGSQSDLWHFNVYTGVRLVIRDDRRTIKGFALMENDIVVTQPVNRKGQPRVDLTPAELRSKLDDLLKDLKLTGAPIILLSTLAWSQPSGKAATPRDNAKARATALVYTGGSLEDRPSLLWSVEAHSPSDDDVYVVLDSYRVDGDEDFYTTLTQDRKLLTDVGLTPPKLIGYKRTKANPVDVSKLKGTEYRVWRRKGMAKLLSGDAEILQCAQDMEYSGCSPSYPHIDRELLTRELGADHMLTTFAERVEAARKRVAHGGTTAAPVRAAANRLREVDKPAMEATKERNMIYKTYPMFHTSMDGLTALAHSNKKLWVDYVNMVDEHRLLGQDEEKKVA